jgi:copper transport protein
MMRQIDTWLRPLGLLLMVAVLAFSTNRVSAHADYKSSVPAANATIVTAPTQVVIVFSEELQAQGNSIIVKDSAGVIVDQGDTLLDKDDANRTTLKVSLKSGLANGTYSVAWKNLSSDGHNEEGSFKFTVGTSAPTSLPQTGGEQPLPLLALLGAGMALSIGWNMRRRVLR